MPNAVALRYVPRQQGNCWSCLESLSNRHLRVVAHKDPLNPGRLTHQIHKKCLLDGHRIGGIGRCYCGAQLDLQRLLRRRNPEPPQTPLLLNIRIVRPEEVLLAEDHLVELEGDSIELGRILQSMIQLVFPAVTTFLHQSREINKMYQNLTNTQESESEILDSVNFIRVASVIAILTQFYLVPFVNGRTKMIQNSVLASTALTIVWDEEGLNLERPISLLPYFVPVMAGLMSTGRGRDLCRRICPTANRVSSILKNDLILGAAIGLSARMLPFNENSALQKLNATLFVVFSMVVCAVAKEILRAHSNWRHNEN